MSMSFADLGVPTHLVDRLAQRGITEAFPIQEAAIPDALRGVDVVGKAATGSGKTLAFGLPLMARLGKARPRQPLALILVPTRELAAQVQKELAQLTSDRGRRIICIYGGTSYNVTRKALNFGVDVVVACPGRLEDMLEQGSLDLSCVETVVVDEADRMADMGFLPAVRRIVGATPDQRHVMLFSATMGPDVQSLVREFTKDSVTHDVVGEEAPSDVDHYFWRVPRDQRPQFVADIVDEHGTAIVFTRTKHGADRLAKQLGERGISAVPLHGDRTQAQRERALRSVKSGQIQVLVATDVAARGIHIDNLPVVIHFDPPAQATDYLHRSGRTGRAGATGVVVSIVADDLVGQVKRMQKALGIPTDSIAPREEARPVRLGTVDEAAAAERVDGQTTKARPERKFRADRPSFERRERRDFAPRGEGRGERAPFERGERRDFAPRGEGRGERAPFERGERRDFAPRGEGRGERAPFERGERRDFAPRGEGRGERAGFERSDRREGGFRTERPSDRGFRGERATESRGARRTSNEAVVQFFNDSKGFGFASDAKGDDLFIHFSNIQGDGFKSLSQGQTITFDEAQGPKGREAVNVRVVGGAAGRGTRERRRPRY